MTLSTNDANDNTIAKLTSVREKIAGYVDYLSQRLKPFLTEDDLKQYPQMSTYVQNILNSSLTLKQYLTKLLNEDALEQKLQKGGLSEYLSIVRHDLRNPMNAIQGYAEMLLEDLHTAHEEILANKIQEIVRAIWEILNLIDEIRITQQSPSPVSSQLIIPYASNPTKIKIEERLISKEELSEFISFKEKIAILIVDDIEENCHVLDQYLRHIGYSHIQAVHDGATAVEMIHKNGFDLVLLDVDMPGMNGIEVLSKIKEELIHQKIMVIMVSAADTMENTIRCIRMGAEDFLSKPFNRDLLNVRIGSCVEKKWFNNKEILLRKRIEEEKQRYERLLNAIFPPSIVAELAMTNEVKTRFFPNVAVLFTDVVNFTKYCDTHELSEIINSIQDLAEMCENVAIKYKLQKIKTIGDGFLVTGGMLTENKNPVLDCIQCAEELLAESLKLPSKWQLRAGIAYGTVIGGIVGHRQYLFDIWGDTVNTAARVQAYAEPSTVALTKKAWEEVESIYHAHSLGLITLKGKDPLEIFVCEKK